MTVAATLSQRASHSKETLTEVSKPSRAQSSPFVFKFWVSVRLTVVNRGAGSSKELLQAVDSLTRIRSLAPDNPGEVPGKIRVSEV